MAIFYLDTSALVKRYRTEQGTEVVEELLADPAADDRFFFCFLAVIELTSAVFRLVKGGQLVRPQRIEFWRGFVVTSKNFSAFGR